MHLLLEAECVNLTFLSYAAQMRYVGDEISRPRAVSSREPLGGRIDDVDSPSH